MELDPTSIQKWLAKMPDDLHAPLDERGEQDAARGRTKATGHNSNNDLVGVDDAAPIITTAGNFKLWDVEDQVAPQDLMTGVDDLPQKTRKRKASPNFERRPRARTKDDRYEYKGKDAERKSGSGDRAKKRTRKSRKHTLNDEFHAPNVPRERLTLRGHMNGGIFSKAKSSRPLSLRDNVPVPADARLLSREKENVEESPLRTKTKTATKAVKRDKNRQAKLEYNFKDCANTVEGKSTTNPGQHPNTSAREENDVVCGKKRQRELGSEDLSRESHLRCRPDGESLERQPEDGAQIAKTGSKSPTLYTWSETDKGKPISEHDIEATLLKLLHAGVSSLDSELDQTCSKDGRERIYFNLGDLKAIMKSREVFWSPEPEETCQNSELSTLIQKPSAKRTMPVEDMDALGTNDSPCDVDQVAIHRSKKARLHSPAVFEQAEEARALTHGPIDPGGPENILHSRQQSKQQVTDANEAENSRRKCSASPSDYKEIQTATKIDFQPVPSSIDMEGDWQLEVADSDRISPGRSFSNWLGDGDLPLLDVDEMVDFKNQPDHYGKMPGERTLPQPHVKHQLGFPANPAYDRPGPSMNKAEDDVVPPGFWRRNRLY